MIEKLTPKLPPPVGWINLTCGLLIPIRLWAHFAYVLKIFAFSYVGLWPLATIALHAILEAFVFCLVGWSQIRRKPSSDFLTCTGGGILIGYSIIGIYFMLAHGARYLGVSIEELARGDLAALSLSDFQVSLVHDALIFIWWATCITIVLFRRARDAAPHPHSVRRLLGFVLFAGVAGCVLRCLQPMHFELYSQR